MLQFAERLLCSVVCSSHPLNVAQKSQKLCNRLAHAKLQGAALLHQAYHMA